MHKQKVVVLGDACIDIHIKLSDYLNEDSTKQMPYRVCLGGTIANTALTLSKLGEEVIFCGSIGNDYTGKQVIEKLKENNIDTSLTIVENELNTVNVFALIDDSGERHLWAYPRENVAYASLDLKHLDLNLIKNASWLHCSGMTLLANGSIQDSAIELFKLAYQNNISTSFDFNTRVSNKELLNPRAKESIEKLLPYVKYLMGSFAEFNCFIDTNNINESLKKFALNNRICIARNGSKGYLALSNDKIISGKAYKVEVLDSTGAGDNFNAGFISAMLNKKSIEEACEFGSAVAAYKISCNEEINYAKIDKFMKEN